MRLRQPPLVGDAAEPAAWMERVLKKRILCHLDTDQSLQGVLIDLAEDGLILRAAKLLGDTETPLAGETFVPMGRVVFCQLDS